MRAIVQTWLLELLRGGITLTRFAVEVAAITTALGVGDDSPAAREVWAIELLLAEFTSGHLDEAELRRELGDLLARGPSARTVETLARPPLRRPARSSLRHPWP